MAQKEEKSVKVKMAVLFIVIPSFYYFWDFYLIEHSEILPVKLLSEVLCLRKKILGKYGKLSVSSGTKHC